MDVESKLRRWQKEVAEARTQKDKLEGERESILRRLRDEHDLSGMEDARAFVEREKEEKDRLGEKLEEKIRRIEEKYGFE